MVLIVRLETADASSLNDINDLLKQLSAHASGCSPELLRRIVEDQGTELWVAKDKGKIVGMGEIALILRPEGAAARIEDVIIDEGQRGKGLGESLLKKLIERAKARGASTVNLTSRPERIPANALYKKLGFKLHETNSYFLNL